MGAALGGGAFAGCLSSDGGSPDGESGEDTTDDTDTTDGSGGLGGCDEATDTAADDTGNQQSTDEKTTDGNGNAGDHSIATTEADCRSEDDADAASVTVAEDTVEVRGTVVVSDPCHAAAFGTVERRDGDLTVVVAPEATDEVCMECVGVVGYTATLAVDGAPETVTVKHRSRGRTRTVETTSA